MNFFNKCRLVRETCEWVVANSRHVKIDESHFERAENIVYRQFDEFTHHQIKDATDEEYLNFLFALDAMNFCFWPTKDFQYDNLAQSVKKALISKRLSVPSLITMTSKELAEHVFEREDIPLIEERARILREVGVIVQSKFDSSFSNIVKSANKSAACLLSILTNNFPNFQDHAIYKGHQIHFYKRAQILIGDIWAHFQAKGIGEFTDIGELTMFADYRVPQSLNHWGILTYSPELKAVLQSKKEIPHGSEYQVEIRAATVVAVERLRQHLGKVHQKSVKSIQIDWFLWEFGQKHLNELPPHHRVLSIYY